MASVWIVPRDGARGRKYHIYFTDPVTGKNTHHKGFERKKDAQDEAHRLRALIDTGRNADLRRARDRTRPLTVQEVAGPLVEGWEARVVKGRLSEVTLRGYKEFLALVLRDFGGRLIADVRKAGWRRSGGMAARRSSTRTRAASSRVGSSSRCSRAMASRSAWTARAAGVMLAPM